MKQVLTKFVAFAMLAFVALPSALAPVSVQAQSMTESELIRRINELMAIIASLQAQTNVPVATSQMSRVCPYVWTRSLGLGSSGQDVLRLQQLLNASPATQVAVSGSGSYGQETMYYGQRTAAAVASFQSLYRSDTLTPFGLTQPTGFFGTLTRAKANQLCAEYVTSTIPTVPIPSIPGTKDEVTLRGEGVLDRFSIDSAPDDTIEEGDNDVPIAELTLEARYGDIEITRMDVALVGINQPTEKDPWDVFEDISLWVDGERVVREPADDDRDYLDEDRGIIRLNRLDIVLKEGESVDMVIAASVQGHVDGAGEDADWTVAVDELRYFDGDGAATDEDRLDDIGDTVSFEIVREGAGEKLSFSLARNNPDSSYIIVDEDGTTNTVTLLNYEIEAEGNDIELERLFVTVETTATTTQVLRDIELKVDGRTFRDVNAVQNSSTNVTYEFDIDSDVVVDENHSVAAEVVVDFRDQGGHYPNGTTIRASVGSPERDATEAYGADDVREFSGSAIGDVHTLVATGVVIDSESINETVETQGRDDTTGIFTLEFDVTAVEGDFYITEGVSSDAGVATTGVAYRLDTPVGFDLGSSTVSGVLNSTADEDQVGVFTVREGETETFTLTVVVDPNIAGYYRVGLAELNYSSDPSGVVATESYLPVPVQDYRTNYGFVNN